MRHAQETGKVGQGRPGLEQKAGKRTSPLEDVIVAGEGPRQARVMLIGQNPGRAEAQAGRPFVGRSGRYLDEVLRKNSIARSDLYITNAVWQKTPGNRRPTPQEIEKWRPSLLVEIERIRPRIIVLMGKVAQEIPRAEGVEYVETYHPTAAMRFPRARAKFEADLHRLRKLMKAL
ncbi:MAG: uracil-DNA glycosylase [Chloroflexi bacterium]|nr:uracil-DNA glycosylase [Chloroflexota bacterium]